VKYLNHGGLGCVRIGRKEIYSQGCDLLWGLYCIMYKYIINYFLLLLLGINLFAIENIEASNIKLSPEIISNSKTKIRDGIGRSIIYLNPRKIWKNSLHHREYNLNFISNITASIGDEKLLDASFNFYLDVWYLSFMSFKFKNIISNNDEIIYRVTDNHGKSVQKSFKIIKNNHDVRGKPKQQSSLFTRTIINPKAWQETTVKGAIQAVYGIKALEKVNEQDFISFCKEDKCIHDSITPIKISLNLKENIESIAILSTATEKSLLALFTVSRNNVTSIAIPMRLEKEGKLFAVAKTKDGKLYKSTSSIVNRVKRIEDGNYSFIRFIFKK